MTRDEEVDQSAVDLTRAAQRAHCLHYRQQMRNRATFHAVLSTMPSGNKFNADAVKERLGPLLDDANGVEVGLEYSAVIYITVPFAERQRMAAQGYGTETDARLDDAWRIAYTERVLAEAHALGADEITVAQHPYGTGPLNNEAGKNPYRIRLWWD